MTTAVQTTPRWERITVKPKRHGIDLLLTATTAISHHDPAVQDDSNRTVFNRQKQVLYGNESGGVLSQDAIDAITARHTVPVELAFIQDNPLPTFVGVALVRLVLDLYAGGDGTGILSGMGRYDSLSARARQEALVAPNLRIWWERLCRSLMLPLQPMDRSLELLSLLFVPGALGQAVLRSLAEETQGIVTQAQAWQDAIKCADSAYAAKAKRTPTSGEWVQLVYTPGDLGASSAVRVVEVPALSANSSRHQVVRGSAFQSLVQQLQLRAALPGQGVWPGGVEAVFYNGGNIRAGAKQPSDPFRLAHQIRDRFPSLGVLGGVTDSFDLGEGRLKVANWLVCRENAAALRDTPAEGAALTAVSVFDLLDDVTLTRQAGESGSGQMIFSFETLAAGMQMLIRLDLSPWTTDLESGALVDAVETFLAERAVIGGQSARGFGRVNGELFAHLNGADPWALRDHYRSYLTDNADGLRADLASGKMGTQTLVCS